MSEELKALTEKVTDGWTVDIIDHNSCTEGRKGARVEMRPGGKIRLFPKRPWSSQGRSFPYMELDLTERDDDTVVDGNVMRCYRTPPPHTAKPRVIVATYVFHPPAR